MAVTLSGEGRYEGIAFTGDDAASLCEKFREKNNILHQLVNEWEWSEGDPDRIINSNTGELVATITHG